jgi:hypothetical protein
MPVRVIRVLEYEFADHEMAEQHMESWGVPANGTAVFGRSGVEGRQVKVRSATIMPNLSVLIQTARVDETVVDRTGPKGDRYL